MIKAKDIVAQLEHHASLAFQEEFDNSGFQIGDRDQEVTSALLTLDVTESVVDEAIQKNIGLIISHHPLLFKGLKQITGKDYVERSVIKAIKNDIVIYSAHTSLDSAYGGLNFKIGEKLGLTNMKVLNPFDDFLYKLVVFVPVDYASTVRAAIFKAGAGKIGDYDSCSYQLEGKGSFKAGEGTNPFVGEQGALHFEEELRIETVVPKHLIRPCVDALWKAHPYEEPAYDIYPLKNQHPRAGMGVVGELPEPIDEQAFLEIIKHSYQASSIKYTTLLNKNVQTIALCGGTGTHLINKAKATQADVFISSDFKYHQFFEAENQLLIVDVGHYESEQFSKELFHDIIRKNFPKFALYFSENPTNPVNYY